MNLPASAWEHAAATRGLGPAQRALAVTERAPGTLNGVFSATKVQFLHADEGCPQRLLEPPQEIDGLHVAQLSDLLAMKLKVVGDRGELRGYFDDVDPDDAVPIPRAEIVDYWTSRQREIVAARGRLLRRTMGTSPSRLTHRGRWSDTTAVMG